MSKWILEHMLRGQALRQPCEYQRHLSGRADLPRLLGKSTTGHSPSVHSPFPPSTPSSH